VEKSKVKTKFMAEQARSAFFLYNKTASFSHKWVKSQRRLLAGQA